MSIRKETSPVEITQLLKVLQRGDRSAFDRLLAVVYQELKRVAQRQMRRERAGHTLDTTGLVHEAYLRLVDQSEAEWQDRAHFFGVAARAMRQILIDHARRRAAQKRGGGWERATLDEDLVGGQAPTEELLALDDALERLGQLDPRLSQVVEYRFFAGLTEEETAALLGITTRTVQRDWAKARAWLHKELDPTRSDG
ncbi:MAG: sigma-70 family RNA polymerase sigma factor [Gemmatimonadales bacterium]|jgi:RNA polymerase sigma factor (TIGR02999 family)